MGLKKLPLAAWRRMKSRQHEWKLRLGRDDSDQGQRMTVQVAISDWILGTCSLMSRWTKRAGSQTDQA